MRLNSTNYFNAYKKCRNQVTKLIKDEKAKYFNEKFKNCNNSKECWQTINKLLNRQSKSTTINEIKANGTDVIGDINVAQEFNNYFCSVGPKLANDILSTDNDPLTYMTPVSTSFEFQDIRIEELRSAIKNLKMSKSPGLDKISVKLLKEAGDTITPSLVLLFNLEYFPMIGNLPKSPQFINRVKNQIVETTDLYQ